MFLAFFSINSLSSPNPSDLSCARTWKFFPAFRQTFYGPPSLTEKRAREWHTLEGLLFSFFSFQATALAAFFPVFPISPYPPGGLPLRIDILHIRRGRRFTQPAAFFHFPLKRQVLRKFLPKPALAAYPSRGFSEI